MSYHVHIQIKIHNFRNFKDINNVIEFNESINVLIGHNNLGKSNVLRTLEPVLSFGSSKRLAVDDFNKEISVDPYQRRDE
ncbi:AAA family ATPase [Anoxybacillus sp. P3H1B]|uniref:AAA family ATPase n=1 Tax=Anoxybacillus sp. P3H1B TaxID=1769293 RepID=UPI0009E7F307